MLRDIRVQPEPFDINEEQGTLWLGQTQIGALVSFLGLMRDFNEGNRVSHLTLEHYPGMTEKALGDIAEEAARRWPVDAIRILHRVGILEPQDPIVLVAVAASHRGPAFRACEFLIDHLKTKAPLWKKETTEAGDVWVQPRTGDAIADSRWVANSKVSGWE
ncbi:MAG: molybdenum cofactor biosynthesis protein MoaE [Chromatiaceae bacterium]